MCHYQDIHAASHHELLNFDLLQQKSHTCEHGVLTRKEGEGKKCPLHSCCLLRREIVFQCTNSTESGKGRCEKAYAEVVFVPPEIERKESTCSSGILTWGKKARYQQGKKPEENKQKALSDSVEVKTETLTVPAMEFWIEDQPERVVRVYFEYEPTKDDGAPKDESSRHKPETRSFWDEMLHKIKRKS